MSRASEEGMPEARTGTDASVANAIIGGNAAATGGALVNRASVFAAGGGTRAAGSKALGSTSAMQSKSSSGANASGYHSQGGSSLIFPSNLGTDATQMNMIMFTPKEITGGGADPRTITFKSFGAPAVVLPIPSGLNTSYTQSWSAASVEGRNAMLADKGGDILKRISTSLTPGKSSGRGMLGSRQEAGRQSKITDIVSSLVEGGSIGGAIEMAREVGGALTSGDFWNETAGGVASELGAMVAAGPAEGLATAAQYTTGMKAVKQTMMAYGGPGFRSFSFTFSLKPFSSGESDTVSKILHTFKLYSAPNQNATEYTRVYDLPAVFKIQFLYGAQEHRHIAKIGHCALTNIGISYGGGKFSTFAGTHAPVQVDLTLTFQEMELLNRQMIDTEQYGGQWPRESSSSAGSFSSDFASGTTGMGSFQG